MNNCEIELTYTGGICGFLYTKKFAKNKDVFYGKCSTGYGSKETEVDCIICYLSSFSISILTTQIL